MREGARQMPAVALQAEVADYLACFTGEVDEHGRPLVVRNGYHDERTVVTSAGAVAVRAPRVNDKRVDPETGERQRFSSAILPPWCRRRGMRAPVLAVGDGALGFWKALREVFPVTREQRCRLHVEANILAALPKTAHPGAHRIIVCHSAFEDQGRQRPWPARRRTRHVLHTRSSRRDPAGGP